MRRQHQVAHDEAAVVDGGAAGFVRQHNKNRRCAVEGVEIQLVHDFRIRFRQLVTQFLVRHRHDDGGLPAHTAGRVQSGFHNLRQIFFGGHRRLKFADAPALFHRFDNLIHRAFLPYTIFK